LATAALICVFDGLALLLLLDGPRCGCINRGVGTADEGDAGIGVELSGMPEVLRVTPDSFTSLTGSVVRVAAVDSVGYEQNFWLPA
jgi:hypothetical protein